MFSFLVLAWSLRQRHTKIWKTVTSLVHMGELAHCVVPNFLFAASMVSFLTVDPGFMKLTSVIKIIQLSKLVAEYLTCLLFIPSPNHCFPFRYVVKL